MLKEKEKEHLIHREYEFPEGYSISTIVMREIDGADQAEAGRLLAALGTADSEEVAILDANVCLLYTSPSPRDATLSRMPSSA